MVSITVQEGPDRSALFVGLLYDISDGGLAVLLDGGEFRRGTRVVVELAGTAPVPAWICHATRIKPGCGIGLSFSPIPTELPEACWDAVLCRDASVTMVE